MLIAPIVLNTREPALKVIAEVEIPPLPDVIVIRPVLLLVTVPLSPIEEPTPVTFKVIAPVALLLRMGPPTA